MSDDKIQFASGAQRGTDSFPFHFMSPHALTAFAIAAAEGAEKYAPYNCLKGLPVSSLFNHAILHLLKYMWSRASDKPYYMSSTEDELGHALWNICQLIHQDRERTGADQGLDDRPIRTPAQVKQMLTAFDQDRQWMKDILTQIRDRKAETKPEPSADSGSITLQPGSTFHFTKPFSQATDSVTVVDDAQLHAVHIYPSKPTETEPTSTLTTAPPDAARAAQEQVLKAQSMIANPTFGDGLVRDEGLTRRHNGYDRFCAHCGKKRIHRTNTAGLCGDCYLLTNPSAFVHD